MTSGSLVNEIKGFFSETLTECPICNNTYFSKFEKCVHFDVDLNYCICNKCYTVFQTPRIPEKDMSSFYASKYRTLYLEQAEPRPQELDVQTKRATHLIDFLVHNRLNLKSHLDIGSGSGALLKESRSRFQCDVSGIEFDDAHRAFASKNGIRMYESLDRWEIDTVGKVELVSLSHVLEHLSYPVSYLSRIRQTILQENGYLLIEVPNLYIHPSLEIAHTFAFSTTSLQNTIEQAGFLIIDKKLHSTPGNSTLPLYVTVLAKSVSSGDFGHMIIDKYARLKRNVGRSAYETERIFRRRLRYAKVKLRGLFAS
jgi:hypothetical protein